MAHERARRAVGAGLALLVAGVACNAAIGGGAVAVLGGAGYLAAQCYDRVRVRVRDAYTGQYTCDPQVSVSDGDAQRDLRPCYTAALTSGSYRITARQPGYVPVTTDFVIPEHPGDCPHYTHSIELTLRREGDPGEPSRVTPAAPPDAPVTPPPAVSSPAVSPPAGEPPAEPAGAPAVPTRSFGPVGADAGAPPEPVP